MTGASQINARFMDSIYINLKEKNGGKGRPEFRLRMCSPHHCCPISSSLACPVKNSFHVPWCHCFAYRIIHHRLDRSLQRPLDCTRHCTFFISTIWDGELVMTRLLQGIALVGAGVILNFQSIQTYVIDAFTLHAASGKLSLILPSPSPSHSPLFFFFFLT